MNIEQKNHAAVTSFSRSKQIAQKQKANVQGIWNRANMSKLLLDGAGIVEKRLIYTDNM